MTLSSKLTASFKASQQTTADLATGKAELSLSTVLDLADGTGAGQADRMWSDRRTIAASGTDDLDLAGVLLDLFGAVTTFARVKGLKVAAAAGNTNNVIVGAAASNGFISWAGGAAHTVTVRPGGFLVLGARDAIGYAVTPGTADILRIANAGAGTPVTYDIAIIGASA